jgi:site-specific recombinase XerD
MSEDLVAEFLEELRRKGRCAETIAGYAASLREFAQHMAGRGEQFPFAVTEEHAFTWRESLLVSRACTAGTAARNLLRVFTFYQWLQGQSVLLVNPLPRPFFRGLQHLPRRIPDTITLHAAYAKLRYSVHLHEQRDYVALDLAYSCGLRRCELHRLDLTDIRADSSGTSTGGTIRVRGKGGRERIVPIGPRALADLLYYIHHVRPKLLKPGSTTPALLISWRQGGTRINPRTLNRAFVRYRRLYGLADTLTPHALRHAFATDLVRNGAPVQDVSRMLGHAKLETTQVYTRLMPTDLRRHHRAYHPRG